MDTKRNVIFFLFTTGGLCAIYMLLSYESTTLWWMDLGSKSWNTNGVITTNLSSYTKPNITLNSRNDAQISHRYTPLLDWKTCAHSPSSVISIKDKKTSYAIGDKVTIDIIVKDSLGRRKNVGGDMIRIWVKDTVNGACAAGYVDDHNNGSYTGQIQLFWAGNVTILARIVAPREAVAFIHNRVEKDVKTEEMIGTFKLGKVLEKKKCTPRLDIAMKFKKICNLTHENSDLPWYCEAPQKLSCSTWMINSHVFRPVFQTQQEQEMMKRVLQEPYMKTSIHLIVQPATHVKTELCPATNFHELRNISVHCNKLPSRLTWNLHTPVGYMHKGKWHFTQCNSTFNGSVDTYKNCLRGKTVRFMGDSTTRYMYEFVTKLLNLTVKTKAEAKGDWKVPYVSSNEEGTISLRWTRHGLPYHTDDRLTAGSHVFIESIPANSEDIIIFHFFLHFLQYPPETIRSHLRRTAKAIKALKVRAPNVKVIVKGPHTFHSPVAAGNLQVPFYDIWGRIYEKIYREELAFFIEDIVYLDVWDITVAAENWDIHPNATVLKPLIDHMMSFVCK